jgi:hypothetical protein
VSKMLGEWYQKTNKTEDTNKVNLFVSSVLCVFWYHSPNVLDTLHICNISWLRVKQPFKSYNLFDSFVIVVQT